MLSHCSSLGTCLANAGEFLVIILVESSIIFKQQLCYKHFCPRLFYPYRVASYVMVGHTWLVLDYIVAISYQLILLCTSLWTKKISSNGENFPPRNNSPQHYSNEYTTMPAPKRRMDDTDKN